MKNSRVNGDPLHLGPRGKSRSERRSGRDPGLTRTEQKRKGDLMQQFRRTGEGEGGNSDAYISSPAWCAGACGGRRLAIANGLCVPCTGAA